MPSAEGGLRRFVSVVWQAPLVALPFALFFGTLTGGGLAGYAAALRISLVFATTILLAVRATELALLPSLRRALPGWRPSALAEGLVYMAVSLAGSLLAALIVHLLVQPGFLGGRRSLLVAMFSLLFALLMTALALVWQYHRSSLEHARREKELELARRIQRSFLPTAFPARSQVEVHAVNVPSRGVSGDFYDVVPDGEALLLAIADVEGKSLPAALLGAMLQASLRTQTGLLRPVAEIVASINGLVCRRSDSVQQFATFFLARADDDLRLVYTNAGHNPPLLLRASGELELLLDGGIMLGVLEPAPYVEAAVRLAPGDRLVLYTDGLTERAGPGGDEYGVERLIGALRALPAELPPREVATSLLADLEAFAQGVEPADDQTLMVLGVRSSSAPDPAGALSEVSGA